MKNNKKTAPRGIILFGLNGAGKTTLGREVARRINGSRFTLCLERYIEQISVFETQ